MSLCVRDFVQEDNVSSAVFEHPDMWMWVCAFVTEYTLIKNQD